MLDRDLCKDLAAWHSSLSLHDCYVEVWRSSPVLLGASQVRKSPLTMGSFANSMRAGWLKSLSRSGETMDFPSSRGLIIVTTLNSLCAGREWREPVGPQLSGRVDLQDIGPAIHNQRAGGDRTV